LTRWAGLMPLGWWYRRLVIRWDWWRHRGRAVGSTHNIGFIQWSTFLHSFQFVTKSKFFCVNSAIDLGESIVLGRPPRAHPLVFVSPSSLNAVVFHCTPLSYLVVLALPFRTEQLVSVGVLLLDVFELCDSRLDGLLGFWVCWWRLYWVSQVHLRIDSWIARVGVVCRDVAIGGIFKAGRIN
jgi:hypothetical protein